MSGDAPPLCDVRAKKRADARERMRRFRQRNADGRHVRMVMVEVDVDDLVEGRWLGGWDAEDEAKIRSAAQAAFNARLQKT